MIRSAILYQFHNHCLTQSVNLIQRVFQHQAQKVAQAQSLEKLQVPNPYLKAVQIVIQPHFQPHRQCLNQFQYH